MESTTIKKINTLNPDVKYKIYDIRGVDTLYGRKVLVELDNFNTFLPTRFSKLTEEQLQEYNKKNLCLRYLGKKDIGYNLHADIIQFEEMV